jgi:tetratricopeptide (TPR) repeat protein
MRRTFFVILLLILAISFLSPQPLNAEEMKLTNPDLIKAIDQYRSGKFVEAKASLLKAKEREENSSVTLYYLGLTYKELLVYDKAVSSLNDAATHSTPIELAFYDIAEIYFHLDKPAKALAAIEKAEKAGVNPAHTAYLKGLVLLSQNKFKKAVKAFDSSKRKDPTLTEAADYQKDIARKKLSGNQE